MGSVIYISEYLKRKRHPMVNVEQEPTPAPAPGLLPEKFIFHLDKIIMATVNVTLSMISTGTVDPAGVVSIIMNDIEAVKKTYKECDIIF